MKSLKYLYLLAAGVMTFASCSDDDSISEPLSLNFSVENLGSTATTPDSKGIGLYISSTPVTDLNQADVAVNQKLVPTGDVLAAEGLNWTGQEELYTYAYYPYSASANPSAFAVAINADQSSALDVANGGLLWAKAKTTFAGTNVSPKLDFKPLMSKLIINVKSTTGAGAMAGSKITLNALKLKAAVNLLDGTVTTSDETAAVKPFAVTANNGYDCSFEVIVAPQSAAAGSEFLTLVNKNDMEFAHTLTNALDLTPGKVATLEVVTTAKECTVTVKDITAWVTNSEQQAGTANKQLLFVYKEVNGQKGIVWYVDDPKGEHGWMMSLDGAQLEMTKADYYSGLNKMNFAGFITNADKNTTQFLQKDPTLDQFPAVQWVDNHNADRTTTTIGTGNKDGYWKMLPTDYVQKFMEQLYVYSNRDNLAAVNAAIEAAPVDESQKTLLPVPDWSDTSTYPVFWTSYYQGSGKQTELDGTVTIEENCQAVYVKSKSASWSNKTTKDAREKHYVRAFYHF